jgi:asparagine synthetase B (glutamine-hydrolysing)
MESYIAKEEYVAGMFGIESRFPFLDKAVVQEFLWLNMELKNKYYKSVLNNYFIENDYPFAKNQKVGF